MVCSFSRAAVPRGVSQGLLVPTADVKWLCKVCSLHIAGTCFNTISCSATETEQKQVLWYLL